MMVRSPAAAHASPDELARAAAMPDAGRGPEAFSPRGPGCSRPLNLSWGRLSTNQNP
jgi:hypothetical protein